MTSKEISKMDTARGLIFIEKDCIRDDLLKVYETLSVALIESGVHLRVLIGPDADPIPLDSYRFEKVDFWDSISRNSLVDFHRIVAGFAKMIGLRAVRRTRNHRKVVATIVNYELSKRYLERFGPDFIVGIKYDSLKELVHGAISMRISTYAIEHANYPHIAKQKNPYEWPAQYIFCWSREKVLANSTQFANRGAKFLFGGPTWGLRHTSKSAEKSDKVLLLESDNSVWSDSFVHELSDYFGDESFAIKPHPHLLREGSSSAYANFPHLCDFSNFWEQSPRVAISLGSSSTSELIYLGVPVVTLSPEIIEEGIFPKAGSFPNSAKGQKMAFEMVADLMGNPASRSQLVERQRQELASPISEASGTLKRIVDFILGRVRAGSRTVP